MYLNTNFTNWRILFVVKGQINYVTLEDDDDDFKTSEDVQDFAEIADVVSVFVGDDNNHFKTLDNVQDFAEIAENGDVVSVTDLLLYATQMDLVV